MRVALIGATGNAGSRILAELVRRGHEVTAVVRNPERVPRSETVTAQKADVFDRDGLAKVLSGHDAVVSSVHFSASDPHDLIEGVRASGVKRYIVVGGAGSLESSPGVRLIEDPSFPEAYKAEATAGAAFLDILRGESELDWTFVSPSAEFFAGERTGKFRLGGDALLVGEAGSRISFEDFAVALVDELESPRHSRRRFTVGY